MKEILIILVSHTFTVYTISRIQEKDFTDTLFDLWKRYIRYILKIAEKIKSYLFKKKRKPEHPGYVYAEEQQEKTINATFKDTDLKPETYIYDDEEKQ